MEVIQGKVEREKYNNRGALGPEKEKDPFILRAWHNGVHKDILYVII